MARIKTAKPAEEPRLNLTPAAAEAIDSNALNRLRAEKAEKEFQDRRVIVPGKFVALKSHAPGRVKIKVVEIEVEGGDKACADAITALTQLLAPRRRK